MHIYFKHVSFTVNAIVNRLNPLSDILGEAGKPGSNNPIPVPPGPKGDKGPTWNPEGLRGPKGDGGGGDFSKF